MRSENSSKDGRQGQEHVLTPATTILEHETNQAREELDRPARGLFISGLLAGFAIGVSLLLMAILLTALEGVFPAPVVRVLEANAYAVGFIVVILGNLDLFTEYTTMAILPVLS